MHRPMLPSALFRHIVFPAEALRYKQIEVTVSPSRPTTAGSGPSTLSEDDVGLLQWVFDQAGVDCRAYRPESLQRRLSACWRTLGVRSSAEARRVLEQRPTLLPAVLNALLVGVTAFFRDPAVFDSLREQVLLPQARGGKVLSIWSIGCSDGSELYSVALLLAGSYLLGTDCRSEAVHRARLGCFEPEAFKNVPPGLLRRYFIPGPLRWQVIPAVRVALRWRTADVLTTMEPGIWDMILCRNTTMYMRPERTDGLWERLETALRPGGVLVVGKAERPARPKRLELLSPCIYRKRW